MRRLRILGGILVAAAALFPASAAPRATVLSNVFKLPLPAAKSGAIYEVDVKLGLPPNVNITGTSGAPFSLSVTNTVPSYIRIAAKVLPGAKPNTFRMLVAINAPKGKVRRLAGDATADLQLNTFPPFTSATATPQSGDKCADLKANEGKGTDIVGRGGSPNEGKTIEKFTEGADPNCKKGGGPPPPKTTTTTTTKTGPCEATPLPKECRFDLALDLFTPHLVSGTTLQVFNEELVVRNEGAVSSPEADLLLRQYVSTNRGNYFDLLIVRWKDCSDSSGGEVCKIPPLTPGGSRTLHVSVTIDNRKAGTKKAREDNRDGTVAVIATAKLGTGGSGEHCEQELEVTCANNFEQNRIVLAAPRH